MADWQRRQSQQPRDDDLIEAPIAKLKELREKLESGDSTRFARMSEEERAEGQAQLRVMIDIAAETEADMAEFKAAHPDLSPELYAEYVEYYQAWHNLRMFCEDAMLRYFTTPSGPRN